MKLITNLSVLLLLQHYQQTAFARPSILQEQNLNYYKAFLQGVHVGFDSFIALMGYYESDEVKQGIESGELVIDEEEEQNQTQIKIVGLGLGRTGTTSVVMALEILGYNVVHDDEQTELTDLYAFWEEDEIDIDGFHQILGMRGFNATFKTAGYEWVKQRDDVKAILTVRDTPEKYVQSWSVAAPFIQLMEQMPYRWMPTVHELYESLLAEYKVETTGGKPEDYLNATVLKHNYLQYIEKVQNAIPSERLLTFNVKQGWGPLCTFLEIEEGDCPDVPFPHVHTRAKLEGEMFFLRAITWIWPLVFVLPLFGLITISKVGSRKGGECKGTKKE